MTFQELLFELEHRLGYHQLPVNSMARGIKDVFESSPVHQELMTQLVRAIYAENRCQRLADPVTRDKTFAAFAPIRLATLRSEKCDVDTHHLLEELCVAFEQIFRFDEPRIDAMRTSRSAPSARVVGFDTFQRRRLLKTWT